MELGNGKHSLGMRVEPGNEANWEVKDIHSPDSLILRLHFPTSLLPTVYVEVADSAPSCFWHSLTMTLGIEAWEQS